MKRIELKENPFPEMQNTILYELNQSDDLKVEFIKKAPFNIGIGDFVFFCSSEHRPSCPVCGTKPHKHKQIVRWQRDIPLPDENTHFNQPVYVYATSQSYICPNCGECISPDFPSFNGHLTQRLADQIVQQAFLFRPYREIADQYFVSVATVANLFKSSIEQTEKAYIPVAPENIAIILIIHKKKQYYVIANMDNNQVNIIDVVDEISSIHMMKNVENIKKVYTSLAGSFEHYNPIITPVEIRYELDSAYEKDRLAVYKQIRQTKKGAKGVNHSRYLLSDRSRNGEPFKQKRQSELLELFPEFLPGFQMRTAFDTILDIADSKYIAEAMIREWIRECEKSGLDCYNHFIDLLRTRKTEILNYYELPIKTRKIMLTRSDILRDKINIILKTGKQYSAQVFRIKAIFGNVYGYQAEKS
ncbi:MAG: transposase [Erysipelotrichaceae bacterium]|nr:transposase [Erysipelotrichaceae bacterium]